MARAKAQAKPEPDQATDQAVDQPGVKVAEAGEVDFNENPPASADLLVGQALKDYFDRRKGEGASTKAIALEAGYVIATRKGFRANLPKLHEALLDSMGLVDKRPPKLPGKPREGDRFMRVSANRVGLLSPLAIEITGAVPGQVFEISYPTGDVRGVGSEILLTLTGEVRPITYRKKSEEQPGTPLLDLAPQDG